MLGVAGFLVAASPAQARSAYCSPSGDYCHGVQKAGGGVALFFRTFSLTGDMDVCVSKAGKVCRTVALRSKPHGLREARLRWDRQFPDRGSGTYTVTWYQDGSPIGVRTHFRR